MQVAQTAKEEREKKFGNSNAGLLDPARPHILCILSVEENTWKPKKGGKVSGIKLTFGLHDREQRGEYKHIFHDYNLHVEGVSEGMVKSVEFGFQSLTNLLESSFDAQIPAANNMAELISGMKQFIERPFVAAIRHRERLLEDQETGKLVKYFSHEIYYTGKTTDKNFRAPKAEKRIVPLKPEERQKFEAQEKGHTDPETSTDVNFDIGDNEFGI